jgi:pyruvate,orthophosphate dikinase
VTCKLLETHYKDMQDIEFTVEDNQLWMLQTRSGKRLVSPQCGSRWIWSKSGSSARKKPYCGLRPTI